MTSEPDFHTWDDICIYLLDNSFAFTFFFSTDLGEFHLDLKNGSGAAGQGPPPQGEANVTFSMTPDMFVQMFKGKVNPTTAFMTGKMKIKGDLGLAMKLEKLMKKMKSQL